MLSKEELIKKIQCSDKLVFNKNIIDELLNLNSKKTIFNLDFFNEVAKVNNFEWENIKEILFDFCW